MGEIVSPSVPSPEEDKNPFYLSKQCPYVGASALQPAQAQLCASRQSPHRALGPQPVVPSPSGQPMSAPKAGWGKAGQSTIPGTTGRAHGRASRASPAWAAVCGQRCGAGGSGSLLHGLSQQQPGRGEQGTSIIHTQRRRGEECRVLEPAAPPWAWTGEMWTPGWPGWIAEDPAPFSSLSQCGFGLQSGADFALNLGCAPRRAGLRLL